MSSIKKTAFVYIFSEVLKENNKKTEQALRALINCPCKSLVPLQIVIAYCVLCVNLQFPPALRRHFTAISKIKDLSPPFFYLFIAFFLCFKINEYSLNLFKLYVNVKTTPQSSPPASRTCLVTLITIVTPHAERRKKKHNFSKK